MSKMKKFAVLAITVSFALAGCSGSSSDEATQSATGSTQPPAVTESPVEGEAPAVDGKATGDGYTFEIPDGWEQRGDLALPGLDLVVVGQKNDVGFADNITTVTIPYEESQSTGFEEASVKKFEASGQTDVVVQEPVTIAGNETIRITSKGPKGDHDYDTDQYVVSNGEKAYLLAFVFGEARPDAERDAVVKSVTDSWTWS